jgi:hypothetical protein
MHAPRKEVSQEDMWTTLAKHAPVKRPQVVATAKPELPPLEWCEPVKTGALSGYVLTMDGHFSVSKDVVRGAPMYTAWDRRPKPVAMAINLGVRLALVEAKKLCELAR